ncbi:SLC13 family permease [Suttonella sp. R2A3]|uniref:SLC13 family permease n=1 Tax=Suttonella sp. R2A3 TaxID=2908648 RepID=UPI001F3EC5EE|nr:SLC13 family permease [Suttonella sp. R2A3]UJF24906.1 SLC13 family permease [Suttonella sp. R2A3]
MSAEIAFVYVLLLLTVVAFIIDRWRMDMVALMVVIVLAVSGVITPAEAVSGFGNTIVVMIAALFVVGEGIFRTGVAGTIGQFLLKIGGKSELRLLLVLLPVVSLLSTSISSTGTVALLIPVVMAMARKAEIHPARLLMPVAFITLIAGMTTLIGTPPNIVVSGALRDAGREAFGFFDFTPVGGLILLVSLGLMLSVGRFLLPKRALDGDKSERASLEAFAERYEISGQLHKLLLANNSPLKGLTVSEAKLRRQYNVTLFALNQNNRKANAFIPAMLNSQIAQDDALWVYGRDEDVSELCQAMHLYRSPFSAYEERRVQRAFGYVEVLIPPDSALVGSTLEQAAFRRHYGLNLIALRRGQQTITMNYASTTLQAGDSLLLAGSWSHIRRLSNERNLVVLQTPVELEDIAPYSHKAPLAIGIMLLMIAAMAFGWLANVSVVLIAAMLMIISGCVSIKESYQSLNETSLVLLAGMLPLAVAMEKSGALQLLVDTLLAGFSEISPLGLCTLLFVLTAVLSQFMSNTATTVLLAPVAISMSQALVIAPEPVMMTVAIAASSAFATPIASPVNSLIILPGGYRFMDFVRIGVPLQLVIMVLTLYLVPIFFPF